MTAINTIRQSHAVHIVSDGAVCNDDGIILEIGPNAFPLPHIPAAVAIRGATHFVPFLIYRLCRDCGSFDELLAKIVGAALEVHISFPMMLGTLGFGNVAPDFDLVVAGWSAARGKPESYLVTSRPHEKQSQPGAGYRLVDLPDVLIAPTISEQQIKAVGWTVPKSADEFKPDRDGLKLLEAQRLSATLPNTELGSPRHYAVGGFVQLTTVSSHGIQIEILHRWPDKVGQRVGG
jgi:hypothetical protein